MRIRRLGWAGIELEADGQTALIDVLRDITPLAEFVGEPRDALPPPTPAASVALATHLHADHCDPLFHGWWWRFALRYGPFAVAFRPVTGGVGDSPPRQPPSPLPAALAPRQAAVAGAALGAREAVPTHHTTLHNPPIYTEVDDP